MKFNADLVVARPDISQVVLGSDAELVVLASDGLWDYINRFVPYSFYSFFQNNENRMYHLIFLTEHSSEPVSIVRNELRQHGNVQVKRQLNYLSPLCLRFCSVDLSPYVCDFVLAFVSASL